jgi:3-hydroxyisobutyrate dehydrogenase-like beta-hydroxyacid dehydrogenase
MSSSPILFVGAGRIGTPIVRRMIARGLTVHVSDTSPEALVQLERDGVTVVDEPGALSRLSYDRALLCLPDAKASAALLAEWTSRELPSGAIVADLTTMSPSVARQHAEMLAKVGGIYLDSPVSGGQRGAETGDMVVVASGPRSAYDEMLPIFNAVGNPVHYVGNTGAASLIKAVNQYVYLSYNLAFAQGLRLGHELGLPEDVMLDILAKGAPAHPLINDRLPSTLRSGFREGFLLKRCLKDLDCLEFPPGLHSSARNAHEQLRSEIRKAVDDGLGERDILILSQTKETGSNR